jgi:CubicO group peptidase (beta-lactamase class C family)
MFLNNGSSILSPRSIAEMRTVVGGGLIPYYGQDVNGNFTEQLPTTQFGLSWYWETMSDGRRYIGHSGALPGMVHLMLVNEKMTVGVIFLSNADYSTPTALSQEIYKTEVNIHMSLFQYFDPDISKASVCRIKGTRFGLFLTILLFFAF